MGEAGQPVGADMAREERGETKDSVVQEGALSSEPDTESAVEEEPDGDFQAWIQVMGSWIVLFNTWGNVNMFGIYQTFYERVLLPDSSSSEIAWIGSIQACLLLAGGVVSGPLFDAGHFRLLLCSGLGLIIVGQFMTSLCSMYWQVLLAQGFCVGIGCGLTFLPSTAVLAQYFSKRRALATGIASSGSPLAGILLPIAFSRLEPMVGFGWATRIVAFVFLALSVIPIVFMRTRLPPSKHARALMDVTALRDPLFLSYLAGALFAFIASYIPFFFIQLFTLDHGLADGDFSSYMVTFMNTGSLIGRFVPSYLADRVGGLEVMSFCTYLGCVLVFAWLGIRNFAGMVVFAVLYGFCTGGIVSLQPVPVYALSSDLSLVGTRLGMLFFATGVAVLMGEPIAGSILGSGDEARWNGLIGFTADNLLIGGSFMLATALLLKRQRRRKMQE